MRRSRTRSSNQCKYYLPNLLRRAVVTVHPVRAGSGLAPSTAVPDRTGSSRLLSTAGSGSAAAWVCLCQPQGRLYRRPSSIAGGFATPNVTLWTLILEQRKAGPRNTKPKNSVFVKSLMACALAMWIMTIYALRFPLLPTSAVARKSRIAWLHRSSATRSGP